MTPQLENGYTKIANEILEIVMKTKLNDTQHRILLTIWRYTYGFNRKQHDLSLSYISKATNIHQKQVQRELNQLINKKIVKVKKEATFNKPRIIEFNKNHKEWELISSEVANELPRSELDTHTGSESVTSRGSESVTQEIKYKENIKENIYSISAQEIFDLWNQQEIITHKKITSEINKVITQAIKKHGAENIKLGIKQYKEILDSEFYYSHKFTLVKFLKQSNGLPNFLDEGAIWENYKSKHKKEVNTSGLDHIFKGQYGEVKVY